MALRRTRVRMCLKFLAAGLVVAGLQAPAWAGLFSCKEWVCKHCPYGSRKHCTAPCPTLLNDCHGYFPTQWHPWPCPNQHVPPQSCVVPLPAPVHAPATVGERALPPAQIMPPVR